MRSFEKRRQVLCSDKAGKDFQQGSIQGPDCRVSTTRPTARTTTRTTTRTAPSTYSEYITNATRIRRRHNDAIGMVGYAVMFPVGMKHDLWVMMTLVLLLPNLSVQANQASDEATTSKYSGELEMSSHCLSNSYNNNLVEVTAVYLTCDSPSAYYYGSDSYRDSLTCMVGDTANVIVELTINTDLSWAGVSVTLKVGVYDTMEIVLDKVDLCSFRGMDEPIEFGDYRRRRRRRGLGENDDNRDDESCAFQGSYELKTSFAIPSSLIEDTELQSTPDLIVKFTGSSSGLLLGCAMAGTRARRENATFHARQGEAALGIALLIFASCFALLLYITYRRKKRLEAATTTTTTKTAAASSASSSAVEDNHPFHGYMRHGSLGGGNHHVTAPVQGPIISEHKSTPLTADVVSGFYPGGEYVPSA